jgi:hypothetical protein
MLTRFRIVGFGLLLGGVFFISGRAVGLAQQPQQAEENLLLIGKFDIAEGRSLNDVIAEASQWVRDLRATGEFKSVRLYMHDWGPELAVYILHEPNSWQAIKTGYNKFFAARPDLMTGPFRWAGHSDNILSEIPVQ